MTKLLDHLLDGLDPGILSQREIGDLRQLRHRYQEIETGLSLGRRLVQGRLDLVLAETQRRTGSGDASTGELLGRLPDVLAQHSRSTGTPRPVPETDIPDFVDVFTTEVDVLLAAEEVGRLPELTDERLAEAAESLDRLEHQLSAKRHELHRIIDEVQDEIVRRYRSGAASVDELLQ